MIDLVFYFYDFITATLLGGSFFIAFTSYRIFGIMISYIA